MLFLLQTIHYKDTINLGSLIIAGLLGLAGLGTFFYGIRWKTAYLVQKANEGAAEENAKIAMEGRAVYKLRSERLEDELLKLQRKSIDATDLLLSNQVEMQAGQIEIHGLVNDNFSKALAEIKSLRAQLKKLESKKASDKRKKA